MTISITAEQLRSSFPDVELELQTLNLEHELFSVLFFQGSVCRLEKSAELLVALSSGYELVIKPLVSSHGGYAVWTRTQAAVNPETREPMRRQILSTHCTIRKEGQTELASAEFEIEASTLERVVLKALYSMQKVGKKRLVPLPIETIN